MNRFLHCAGETLAGAVVLGLMLAAWVIILCAAVCYGLTREREGAR